MNFFPRILNLFNVFQLNKVPFWAPEIKPVFGVDDIAIAMLISTLVGVGTGVMSAKEKGKLLDQDAASAFADKEFDRKLTKTAFKYKKYRDRLGDRQSLKKWKQYLKEVTFNQLLAKEGLGLKKAMLELEEGKFELQKDLVGEQLIGARIGRRQTALAGNIQRRAANLRLGEAYNRSKFKRGMSKFKVSSFQPQKGQPAAAGA